MSLTGTFRRFAAGARGSLSRGEGSAAGHPTPSTALADLTSLANRAGHTLVRDRM